MENQRIRLSKTLLKDALMALMETEDISRITISQLCGAAQINRTTFYKYYSSIYDLLADIEKDVFRELGATLGPEGSDGDDRLVETIAYLDKNRDRMQVLFNTLSNDAFYDLLMDQAFINTFLDEQVMKAYSPEERDYLRLFFSQGIYAILRAWINKEGPESPAELAALIRSVRKRFE